MSMRAEDETAADLLHEWRIPVTDESLRMAKGTFAFSARRIGEARHQLNAAIIASLPRWLRRWYHAA